MSTEQELSDVHTAMLHHSGKFITSVTALMQRAHAGNAHTEAHVVNALCQVNRRFYSCAVIVHHTRAALFSISEDNFNAFAEGSEQLAIIHRRVTNVTAAEAPLDVLGRLFAGEKPVICEEPLCTGDDAADSCAYWLLDAPYN